MILKIVTGFPEIYPIGSHIFQKNFLYLQTRLYFYVVGLRLQLKTYFNPDFTQLVKRLLYSG